MSSGSSAVYEPYRQPVPSRAAGQYRGANAGDFSGINEIDLLLGLCRASDPHYAHLLVDKMLFMVPGDRAATAQLSDAS